MKKLLLFYYEATRRKDKDRPAPKTLKTELNVHVRNEMQNEVLGSQGISQEDVSEVCEQLRPDGGHLAQGRR